MQLSIDIPKQLEDLLIEEWGDLSVAAREALVIECYRRGKISVGFLAQLLGIGVIQADEWLAQRGVPLSYTLEDLEAARRDLAKVFPEMRR